MVACTAVQDGRGENPVNSSSAGEDDTGSYSADKAETENAGNGV